MSKPDVTELKRNVNSLCVSVQSDLFKLAVTTALPNTILFVMYPCGYDDNKLHFAMWTKDGKKMTPEIEKIIVDLATVMYGDDHIIRTKRVDCDDEYMGLYCIKKHAGVE